MVTIKITDNAFLDTRASCYALLLNHNFTFSEELSTLAEQIFPALQALLKERQFTGALQQTVVVPFLHHKPAHLIITGVGKPAEGGKIAVENYRRALAKVIRVVEDLKADSLSFLVPAPDNFGLLTQELAEQTASLAHIAEYHFDEYITDESRKVPNDIDLTLVIGSLNSKEFEKGVKEGSIVAHAVNQARHWIDLPPVKLTPIELATHAQTIAKKRNLKITVFNEKEVNQMGMGGLSAVSRGSDHDCQLVIMEYKGTRKDAPTVALVGKGITFDSGGLSIKPAASMETMKEDMSGAAAVICVMDALAQLKPKINVIGIMPISENLPSGKATKPGDICRFYNGKTAEIKNTDAEGRLILADALSYTVKHYKPDAIIDIATLTGAISYALGPFFAGLMSEHDPLVMKLYEAAQRSGDRVWRLPLNDDFKPAIRSDVADLSNTGSPTYLAGSITAAHFLQNFVSDTPWAHLDIAGVAFDVPDIPYYRKHSATGFGVRLLVDVVMNW
jgi:leucyl aminopeptidase